MNDNVSGAKVRNKSYCPAGDEGVLGKNLLLFIFSLVSMIYGLIRHYSLFGLISTVSIAILLLYYSCLNISTDSCPNYSIKFKLHHFLFFPIFARCLVLILQTKNQYEGLLSIIHQRINKKFVIFFCLSIAIIVIGNFASDIKFKKFMKHSGVVFFLLLYIILIGYSTVLLLCALFIPLIFFLTDCSIIIETEYYSKKRIYIKTPSVLYAAILGLSIITTVYYNKEQWDTHFLLTLSSKFTLFKFIYNIVVCILMLLATNIFLDEDSENGNNTEYSFFLFLLTTNILVWMIIKFPTTYGFIILGSYFFLTIPFYVCYGKHDLLSALVSKTKYNYFSVHCIISIFCAFSYIGIYCSLPIATLLFICYAFTCILLHGLTKYHHKLFSRHGTTIFSFLIYLAVIKDIGSDITMPLFISGGVLLIVNVALLFFDYQERCLMSTATNCQSIDNESSNTLMENLQMYYSQIRVGTSIIKIGYIITIAIMIAKSLHQ